MLLFKIIVLFSQSQFIKNRIRRTIYIYKCMKKKKYTVNGKTKEKNDKKSFTKTVMKI